MGTTNLDNLVLEDAESAVAGRGDITAQFARMKADLDALTALTNDLKAKYNAAVTLINELKADFNIHTHRADGAQAGQYNTSLPQSDAQTVTPVTAVSITATNSSTTAVADVVITTK